MCQHYKKNDIVTVSIEDIGTDGEGIGKTDGFILFVKDAVVGDVVEARITKAKKQYAYARLEKLLTASPFRTDPKCPHYRQCGGCQIQALNYEKQLEYKQQKVRNNLIRIGGFKESEIDRVMDPIIGMEEPYRYRNKAQYPVGTDREGHVVTGFYAGRTHTIIPSTECYLGVAENKEILEILIAHMEKYNIPAYDEAAGKGLVRHILIRKGFATGEIMVCVVINGGCQGQGFSQKEDYIPYQSALVFPHTRLGCRRRCRRCSPSAFWYGGRCPEFAGAARADSRSSDRPGRPGSKSRSSRTCSGRTGCAHTGPTSFPWFSPLKPPRRVNQHR